jgi:hypothetical protein
MEGEIVALAHGRQELFPVMDILIEVGKAVGLETRDLMSMHVSI